MTYFPGNKVPTVLRTTPTDCFLHIMILSNDLPACVPVAK